MPETLSPTLPWLCFPGLCSDSPSQPTMPLSTLSPQQVLPGPRALICPQLCPYLPINTYSGTGCSLSYTRYFTALQSRHLTRFTKGERVTQEWLGMWPQPCGDAQTPKCTLTTLISLPLISFVRTVSLRTGVPWPNRRRWGLGPIPEGPAAPYHAKVCTHYPPPAAVLARGTSWAGRCSLGPCL